MKKALKITGIILASLVGLVLIVAVVASILVTSSGWLTKQVKKYAPEFITCEMQLGKADLTLFKTFPNVGIGIENVALINPMAGSPSDTLANIDNLIVVVDAKKLLKEKEIMVKKCILEDAFVNLYTDSIGQSNLNVFKTKEDNDTMSSFDYGVDIEEVKLKNTALLYTDDRNGMTAQAQGLNLDLKGKMQDKDIDANLLLKADDLSLKMQAIQLALKAIALDFDGELAQYDQINGTLKLSTPDVSLNLKEPYLDNDTLNLNLPLQFNIKDRKGHLDQSQIGLNRFLINMSGDVEMPDNGDINLDLTLKTNTLSIEDILSYLPEKLQQRLSSIEYAGKIQIKDAVVEGTYNDSLMPLISAKVLTDKAMVNVPRLPYPFTDFDLDANLNLDLNSDANSLTVNSLQTKFNKIELNVNGVVNDLLGDIELKLKVQGNMPMTDIKGFLPKDLKLNGRTDLDLTTNFTLKQLMKSLDDYNFNRLKASATLKIKDFTFDIDTIHAISPMLNVGLTLPASAKQKNGKGVFITLNTSQLRAKMGKTIDANLINPNIRCSADNLKGGMEQLLLDAALNFGRVDLGYENTNVHMNNPVISFVTMPEKNSKNLKARVTLNGKEIHANKGRDYVLNSNVLIVDATVNENKNKTDFLNRWSPSADFVLGNAVLKVKGLDEDLNISNIDFLFNSSELDFKKSTFRIGRSDLTLQGSVIGIKEWIEDHKSLMRGELQVTSNFLDINEILDITNGLGRSEDELVDVSGDKEANPFMVPGGVDFNFVLNTKKALYDNFDINNLNGTMTVKDGTLILQEIGFTNKAAEMQLTAMYQSPRRDHLSLDLDFHLLNVQIHDLLHMIPYIDTLVPMLKTFDGQAEFHIGAGTKLNANYEPKISTLLAAADIEGKNLTVNDHFTFTKITDMLDVSTNGEYRVDSLDVQLTVLKDQIYLWPSQIAIGNYKVTVDGNMTLDKSGVYHLSVTQSPLPVRMGLKISGPINHLDYQLESCKFPNLYKPNKRSDREQMYFDLKKKIADRLKENVR